MSFLKKILGGQSNFEFVDHNDEMLHSKSIVMEMSKLDEISDYISKSDGVNSIVVKDNGVTSLDFLSRFPNLEGLTILSENLDLSPIEELKNLTSLVCIRKAKGRIDLSNHPELRQLSIEGKNFKNIEACKKVENLHLQGYKNEDINEISSFLNLKKMSMHSTSIVNIEGISDLNKLEMLEIQGANKLESLNGLNSNHVSLEKLEVFKAKSLVDVYAVNHLKNLKKLFLQKIPDVENLDFMKDLKNLEMFILGCEVAEINASYLENIQKVAVVGYKGENSM